MIQPPDSDHQGRPNENVGLLDVVPSVGSVIASFSLHHNTGDVSDVQLVPADKVVQLS